VQSFLVFFFFKQKTAYEMRISDWSSDVCSSDLDVFVVAELGGTAGVHAQAACLPVCPPQRSELPVLARQRIEPVQGHPHHHPARFAPAAIERGPERGQE